MICMWQELLSILPVRWRNRIAQENPGQLQEIRLRLGQPVELVGSSGVSYLNMHTQREDILFCINTASEYSPWTSASIANGYITAPGGHRIGLCGNATVKEGVVTGIGEPSSLCIRVAKDFPGCAAGLDTCDSMLILGHPGSGKTTLLRDLVRQIARREAVAVVDERCEVFPKVANRFCFASGKRTDVLSGCSKSKGVEMVLRSMGPAWIAMDEITSKEDTQALLECAWCGVKLVATAHAGSVTDFQRRGVYKPLLESGLFQDVIVFSKDHPYAFERICL